MKTQSTRLTVGNNRCDIPGFTNTTIQCAVDRAAMLGGGQVDLSEGVFQMADSLHLRSGVTVRGRGNKTILKKNAMKSARITAFLGYGHYDLLVDKPDVFTLGDGVIVRDDNAIGFYTTVATLVRREGDTWFINRPHNHDYLGVNGGVVETLFPVVAAVDVNDVALEDLRIEGNSRNNPVTVNGCRAGGFLALRANRLKVRGVVVRDYNGDGIGFQTCDDAEITDCVVEQCTGVGFHPGSGTNRFHLRGCTARRNGRCGLFYCLRVRHGLLEDSLFEDNGLHGVSIGERDTDNVNRNLTLRGNGGAGLYIRPCSYANAAHNSVVEGCTLDRNCRGKREADAEIVLQGETDGLRVVGNTIRHNPRKPAILIRKEVRSYEVRDNRIAPSGKNAIQDSCMKRQTTR